MEMPGVFTTGGLRLSSGLLWNFSFPEGEAVSSAHESDNRLGPMSREAGSGGGHPPCGSERQGSLTESLHTRHTVGIPVGRQRAQLQATTQRPLQPPICRQQLFLTGVPLSTADGDRNGPVGRQHVVPPPAHADVFTDTQLSPHSALRHLASGCRWSQAPTSARGPFRTGHTVNLVRPCSKPDPIHSPSW